MRRYVLALGHQADGLAAGEFAAGTSQPCDAIDRLGAASTDVLHHGAPILPYVQLACPGILVVFKPKDWEVNRGDPEARRRIVEWQLLSDWVNSVLPRSQYCLPHMPEYDFGFVHRLDVPSSGLILTATTFAGLASLRFQLDTHEICREYIVLVINPMDPRLGMINCRLSKHAISAKSYASPTGAPALSRIRCCAHSYPLLDPDAATALVSVKICTGRHHQIRVHLSHHAHPAVSDGKYSLRDVMLRDPQIYKDVLWFEERFGVPVVPLFSELGPGCEDLHAQALTNIIMGRALGKRTSGQ